VYCSWRAQLGWIVGLLALYSVLLLLVPVPGIGAGVLEPGKDMGAYIDRLLMDGHLWRQSRTWDPEGLLSTIPALCSQLIGVLAGRWLLAGHPRTEQTVWLLLAGLLLLWLGAMLDVVLMPINKSLWTPSFCMLTSGWALIVFGAFFWLLDANPSASLRSNATRWSTPLLIYGMNALFIFAFSSLVAKMLAWITVTGPDGGAVPLSAALYAPLAALDVAPVNSSLLYALLFNAAMFAVAWGMWRKKWFVKV
jgi:predicted acyltransferase